MLASAPFSAVPNRPYRVLGIDPGLRNTGWGVVTISGTKLQYLGHGVCKTTQGDLAPRLAQLHQDLTQVIEAYKPDMVAVERIFVNTDAVGTLKLAHARAVALLVPALAGLPVAEYAPNTVKKAVVGVGHADKKQVQHMIQMLLPSAKVKAAAKTADAADALAIAICHAYQGQAEMKRQAALSKQAIKS